MGKLLRNMHVVCILMVLGVFLGCSSDDSVTVPNTPDPPDPPAPAMGGTFGVYSAPAGDSRNLYDTGGLVTVYVVHNVPDGATASEFRVAAPYGWTLVGTKSQFPLTIGHAQQGISIAYGSCQSGSINLLSLTYQTPGTATNGTEFEVMPHPYWPDNIQVVDCNNNKLTDASGLTSSVQLWISESDDGGIDKKNPNPEEL